MRQLEQATAAVEGSCPNWNHLEEEGYSYLDSQDKERESQAAQHRALARLKLDHFRRCGCEQVQYRMVVVTV